MLSRSAHSHPLQLHVASTFSVSPQWTFSLKGSIPGHRAINATRCSVPWPQGGCERALAGAANHMQKQSVQERWGMGLPTRARGAQVPLTSCRGLAPWVGQISGGSKSWGEAASVGLRLCHSLTEMCELREPLGNACGHRGGLGLSHAGAGLCDPCGSFQDALRMLSVAPSVPEVTQLGGLGAPAGPVVTRQGHRGCGEGTGCCVLCATCAGPEGTEQDEGGARAGQCLELVPLLGRLWGFLGDVLVVRGTAGEWEVIPGLRPDSHAAHPSDGSSSPSHPGAVSDSFPFSSPLALTSFRGFPWRAEPAQPLPSPHRTPTMLLWGSCPG